MKRSVIIKKLQNVLGYEFVQNSGLALPELLEKAAVAIFYNCDNDNDLGQTSYLIRLAMKEIKTKGYIEFEMN